MQIIRIKPSLDETVLRKMYRFLGFTYENTLNNSYTKNHKYKVFTV
jgi:hypothetical protein